MDETAIDELGPIDYVVVEFRESKASFAGALATELASLVDAELIRVLDVVIIDKGTDGTYDVREFDDLRDGDALGDLRALDGQLAEVLAVADLDQVAGVTHAGTTAAIVVFENSWAAPLADAAQRSGGHLVADGRIPTQAVVDALEGAARAAEA
jgi:hypothetical protein